MAPGRMRAIRTAPVIVFAETTKSTQVNPAMKAQKTLAIAQPVIQPVADLELRRSVETELQNAMKPVMMEISEVETDAQVIARLKSVTEKARESRVTINIIVTWTMSVKRQAFVSVGSENVTRILPFVASDSVMRKRTGVMYRRYRKKTVKYATILSFASRRLARTAFVFKLTF